MKKHFFSYFLFFFGISQLLLSQKNLNSLTANADWREYYDYVSPFEDGQAVANVYKKQVLLEKEGRELIPLRYHEVSRYVNGVAWVRFDEGWGKISVNSMCERDFKHKFFLMNYPSVKPF